MRSITGNTVVVGATSDGDVSTKDLSGNAPFEDERDSASIGEIRPDFTGVEPHRLCEVIC
jgi:hypothetical protein